MKLVDTVLPHPFEFLFEHALEAELWDGSWQRMCASYLHRAAWLEDVERYGRKRTAQFLNELDLDRLIVTGKQGEWVIAQHHDAWVQHRMSAGAREKAPRLKRLSKADFSMQAILGGTSE